MPTPCCASSPNPATPLSNSTDPDALQAIVDTAVQYKLGARGLRSIMEAIMTPYMFDLPEMEKGSTLTITRQMALDQIDQSQINNTLA